MMGIFESYADQSQRNFKFFWRWYDHIIIFFLYNMSNKSMHEQGWSGGSLSIWEVLVVISGSACLVLEIYTLFHAFINSFPTNY